MRGADTFLPAAFALRSGSIPPEFNSQAWPGIYPLRGADFAGSTTKWSSMEPSPWSWGRQAGHRAGSARGAVVPAGVGPTASTPGGECCRRSYPTGVRQTSWIVSPTTSGVELSPLAWGRRRGPARGVHEHGAIPTCAGPTSRGISPAAPRWSYPHVRGADVRGGDVLHPGQELSPRARGRRHDGRAGQEAEGAIPTCAGPTVDVSALGIVTGSYPHGRGVDLWLRIYAWLAFELSPRARGRRLLDHDGQHPVGAIPLA